MFTGIISDVGKITAVSKNKEQSLLLEININRADIALGESVACDGVCLTVSKVLSNCLYQFQVSKATLAATNIVNWRIGYCCNIELAMQAKDRFGGHFVSGHVDCLAKVESFESDNDCKKISLSCLIDTKADWISKGSVALNGVSLTLNLVNDNNASIMLVPHTLAKTNLSSLQKNDLVNVEFDMLCKMIKNQFKNHQESL